MKKFILFLLFFSIHSLILAQDVIVKLDGSTIISKVLEVNTSDVKYKKYSNLNGPTYTINKADILSINYENGDKDTFAKINEGKTDYVNQPIASTQTLLEKEADKNNSILISKYNTECHSGVWEDSKAPLKTGYLVYWFSPSSILSNDEIEMNFVSIKGGHDIEIKNKTNDFILVDLKGCFRKTSYGEELCYFDEIHSKGTLQLIPPTEDESSSLQRFMPIPPFSTMSLTNFRFSQAKVEVSQYYATENFSKFKVVNLNKICHAGENQYDEDNSPSIIDYTITYSTKKDFSTYSKLHSKLYLKTVVGSKHSSSHISMSKWGNSKWTKIENYLTGVTDNTLVGIKMY